MYNATPAPLSLFEKSLRSGNAQKLWARFSGRSRSLVDLNELKPELKLHGQHYAGVKAVLIREIVGTEGRAHDFDASFNPLNEKTRDRWISIASARLHGQSMPAVELIQVGQAYYVRDGHHRLSVARAFEEEAVDAQVTVWD